MALSSRRLSRSSIVIVASKYLCSQELRLSVGLGKVSPDHSSVETENRVGVLLKDKDFSHLLKFGIGPDNLGLNISAGVSRSLNPNEDNGNQR